MLYFLGPVKMGNIFRAPNFSVNQTTREKIKETVLLFALNIAFPTADVGTDVALAARLWHDGHPKYAAALATPFLVN